MTSTADSAPPASHLFLLEAPRAYAKLAAMPWLAPFVRMAAEGNGHPALALPTLSGDDRSTCPVRAVLRDQSYVVYRWYSEANLGRPSAEGKPRDRLAELTQRHRGKVSVFGWSLGEIYARNLANHAPQSVRCVVKLGSAFTGNPRASKVLHLHELLSERRAGDWPARDRHQDPPLVLTTAICSRSHGVVAWQSCVESGGPLAESIEVDASHSGLGHDPAVLRKSHEGAVGRASAPWRRAL